MVVTVATQYSILYRGRNGRKGRKGRKGREGAQSFILPGIRVCDFGLCFYDSRQDAYWPRQPRRLSYFAQIEVRNAEGREVGGGGFELGGVGSTWCEELPLELF